MPLRTFSVGATVVGNAVQHGSLEAPVSVAVQGTADEVTVAVHNRGPVILPGVFSPLVELIEAIVRTIANL